MSLAEKIGKILGKEERTMKFYALRMMFEILEGERMSVPMQKKLYNKAQAWHPEDEKTRE